MRFAVISDIHNNLEAFRTALDDIKNQNVDKICCLGDLLGYGPNPLECIDRMMELCAKGQVDVCLLGNHDQATLFDPEGFNRIAEDAVFWTRKVLEDERGVRAQKRGDFLGELPRIGRLSDDDLRDVFLFVHGSPRNPLNEYVFPEDVQDRLKMSKLFSLVPQYCFMGHTHVPGVFLDGGKEGYQYYSYQDIANDFDSKFPLDSRKLLINVGSIGQPRDYNPHSCYVIVQYENGAANNSVEYRRVPYDVEKTADDFAKIPELAKHPFLAQRIREGR